MKKMLEQRVYTDVEFGVNYVTHLYTLAGAGFYDESYVKKYQSSVLPDDGEFLRQNANLMSFMRRDFGPFAELLYFTPAYFNFETAEEISEYFNAWNNAVKQKSFLPFARFSLHPEHGIQFFGMDNETWEQQILPLNEIFNKISQIYVVNLDYYKIKIWPEVKPILVERSESLNHRLQPNLIGKWEDCTGCKFEGAQYQIILFYAGENAPSWNNLSLDKNTAFYNLRTDYMIAMISHELGIHILRPYLKETILQDEKNIPKIDQPGIYGNVSYMASESLAAFYNERLSDGKLSTGCKSNDYSIFKQIFESLYYPNMQPLDLYMQGVNRYLELKGKATHER